MNIPNGYIPTREAIKILHCSASALREWSNKGRIKTFKFGGKGSHRYYDISGLINCGGECKEPEKIRRKICYCRVSSRGQADDLKRQVEFLKQQYPTYEFIQDIGSGINFKRRGIRILLEYAYRGEIEEVVVAYRDRLCRFGFEIFEFIFEKFSGGKIVVLNRTEDSPQAELVGDVLSIINVFSARINGLRKYKRKFKAEFESDKSNKTQEKESSGNQKGEDKMPEDKQKDKENKKEEIEKHTNEKDIDLSNQ